MASYDFDVLVEFEKTKDNLYLLTHTYVINRKQIQTLRTYISKKIIGSDAWNPEEPTFDIVMTISNGITYAEIYTVGKPCFLGFYRPSVKISSQQIENDVSVFCCSYTKKWRTVYVIQDDHKIIAQVFNQ